MCLTENQPKMTETETPSKPIDFQLFRSVLIGQNQKNQPNQTEPITPLWWSKLYYTYYTLLNNVEQLSIFIERFFCFFVVEILRNIYMCECVHVCDGEPKIEPSPVHV